MADGRRGGIVKADELMEEVKQKRAEEAARFAALGDDVTGRGATTVGICTQGARTCAPLHHLSQPTPRPGVS